jgi:hypothetical protein
MRREEQAPRVIILDDHNQGVKLLNSAGEARAARAGNYMITKITIALAAAILVIAGTWYALNIPTFNSLSEPDAGRWLRSSEVVLLVSAALLTLGLLGEWPDSDQWKKRLAYKVAKALVIIGVVGELLGDAGIFETSARLQVLQETAISKARDDLDKERQKTSARPWKKEQFDAIQEVRGKVEAVGVVVEKGCNECRFFANHITRALHEAGVELYGDENSLDGFQGTGIFVYLPVGADFETDPLMVALRKAELSPSVAHHSPELSKIRTDMPVIFVGEKFVPFFEFPFSPPGGGSWTIHPLRK